MILIKKKNEPKEWEKYRNTPGVDYQAIPELVESLLNEQGYICAYCMRRIPHKDIIFKGTTERQTDEDHRVEHILSREKHDDKKLEYMNMVICCPGHIGEEDHCDRLKGSRDLSFSPLDQKFIDTLSYSTDGTIKSSTPRYDKEINEVLNLNTKLLKQNRKAKWDAVLAQLKTIHKDKEWKESILRKAFSKYSEMHNEGGVSKHEPYCGIVTYFLEKKLRQF